MKTPLTAGKTISGHYQQYVRSSALPRASQHLLIVRAARRPGAACYRNRASCAAKADVRRWPRPVCAGHGCAYRFKHHLSAAALQISKLKWRRAALYVNEVNFGAWRQNPSAAAAKRHHRNQISSSLSRYAYSAEMLTTKAASDIK